MPIQAGDFDRRIKLQRRTQVDGQPAVDPLGRAVDTWVDVETVWAKFIPDTGREYFAAGATGSEYSAVLRIYANSAVTPDMRAIDIDNGNVVFSIMAIVPSAARGEALDLMCVVGERDKD